MKYRNQFAKLPLLIAEGQCESLKRLAFKNKAELARVFGVAAKEVDALRSEYSDFYQPYSKPIIHFKAQI